MNAYWTFFMGIVLAAGLDQINQTLQQIVRFLEIIATK